jgi:hypothetical protein
MRRPSLFGGLNGLATALLGACVGLSAVAIGQGITTQTLDSLAVDLNPGLGPNDAAAPSVIQPDTAAHASTLLPANQSLTVGPVSALQVRPNVYMLTAGGANFALLTGPQGTVVVDSGGSDCPAVVMAVQQVIQGPIRYVIETSADADRVACIGAIVAVSRQFGYMDRAVHSDGKAPVIAHQNVLLRLSQGSGADSTPTDAFTRPAASFAVNGQGIQALWMPAAHSDGDAIVMLRQADVIVTGNIFDVTRFPVIDVEHGGSIQGEINALNLLVEQLTIPPAPRWQGWYGTLIIPGRGHLCDQADVLNYRDMLTIVRDRIAALMDQKMSLAQVQAADPTRGYAARFGASSGSWTTRDFVAAVYKSLQAERRPGNKG